MGIICLILTVIGVGTLVAEFWTGIAVTGWQGEKPYVERAEQPALYWTMMLVQFALLVGIPSIGYVLTFDFAW